MINYDPAEPPRRLTTSAIHSCIEGYELSVGGSVIISNLYNRTCTKIEDPFFGMVNGWNGKEPECVRKSSIYVYFS